ncbi:MAG: citrate synthase/methylcitrate synthase [Bacteroidetes bacterium QS_8_68_15]|nr:MAG: citrate synthase/methylcitrate synthase [Bacteroidetes bacterium QS_8_68_15]
MSNTSTSSDVADGLEGVVVAETNISEVDGEAGRLIIAGERVETLCEERIFEALAVRLRSAAASGTPEAEADAVEAFRERLGQARRDAFDELTRTPEVRRRLFDRDVPMNALRTALSVMESTGDPDEDALRAIGAAPVANALWLQTRDNQTPLPPDPDAGHAHDYLRMLLGEAPPPAHADALESYLMAIADHGVNASTFTARVITSTGADLISALVGAVGALKGPLHGGAPGPVLDMLDEIGTPEAADGWIAAELDAGRRIMGMGHRVYRVRDPRATVFEREVERLFEAKGDDKRLALARAVEEAAERRLRERYPDRALRANVEFYTAVLLEAVGVPRALFTATFAAGRTAGWAAHVAEQTQHGRLIRPSARYVGPRPGD